MNDTISKSLTLKINLRCYNEKTTCGDDKKVVVGSCIITVQMEHYLHVAQKETEHLLRINYNNNDQYQIN